MNFNVQAYMQNKSRPFVHVLNWQAETGVVPCNPDDNCKAMQYNTKDNSIPKDTPPDIVVVLPLGTQIAFYFLAAILWIVTIAFGFGLWYYRHSKLIKASQPIMLYFILVGQAFAAARVLNVGLPITDATCIAGHWMGHLAFFFVFGALFIKTWRVNKLVCSVSHSYSHP